MKCYFRIFDNKFEMPDISFLENIGENMKKSLFSGLALGVSVLLYGCSTTLQVVNYPGFFTDSNTYSSIAIAPVQNDYDYARLAHRVGRVWLIAM